MERALRLGVELVVPRSLMHMHCRLDVWYLGHACIACNSPPNGIVSYVYRDVRAMHGRVLLCVQTLNCSTMSPVKKRQCYELERE